MRIKLAATCALLAGFIAQSAYASGTQDVQMLPPMQPGTNNPCSFTGSDQVLMLHDTGSGTGSAINCNQHFTATPTGDVGVGASFNVTGPTTMNGPTAINNNTTITGKTTFTGDINQTGNLTSSGIASIGWRLYTGLDGNGSTGYFWLGRSNLDSSGIAPLGYHATNGTPDWAEIGHGGIPTYTGGGLYIENQGPLTNVHASTLMQLAALNCGAHKALSITNGGGGPVASCVDIVDLADLGPVAVPDCASIGAALTWNGTAFSCVTQTLNISCPAGSALTGISNNQPVCTAVSPPPPTPVALTPGIYQSGGNWALNSNGAWYAGATATCPTGYVATGGGGQCASAGGTNSGLIYSNPVGSSSYYASCVNIGDPNGGAGVTASVYCVPSTTTTVTIGTASGGWALNGNGAYYANATAQCPSGYVATGGGAACDSAGGTFTSLIYNNPFGSSAWYGSCLNIGNPFTGSGVSSYVYCVAENAVKPITVISSNGGWSLNSNGAWYANATAQCPSNYAATGAGAACASAGGTSTSVIYSDPIDANSTYGSCVNIGDPQGGAGVYAYAMCAQQ